MMLCLLLTAPYLGGEMHEVRESEIPNAHSMVRKTVRRKVKVLAPKEQSQRKERLILKGDILHMPMPTMDTESKKFYTLLPVAVNGFCSGTSKLAHFVRKTLWNSGLSKKATRSIVKSFFPSNSAVRREARRMGLTTGAILEEYTSRQRILHRYLSSQLHFNWLETFVEQAKMFEAERLVKLEEIDKLGGYIGIIETKQNYASKLKTIRAKKASDLKEVREKFERFNEWSKASPKTVTPADLQRWKSFDETMIGKLKSDIAVIARKQLASQNSKIEERYDEEIDAVKAELETIVTEHSSQPATIAYKEMRSLEESVDYFTYLAENAKIHLDITLVENEASWMNPVSSRKLDRDYYFLSCLDKAHEDTEVLPILHHPALINYHDDLTHVTPSVLADAMTESFSNDEIFCEIPRDTSMNKLKLRAMKYDEVQELSLAYGLPTRLDNIQCNRKLDADELKTQFTESKVILGNPTGVLALLGTEMNQAHREGEVFKQRWAGKIYSFSAPTHAKDTKNKVDSRLAALAAKLGL